ncbi:MAG: succinate dehydrogenase assembly factor 2 [Rhodobacteraceae bacterium]|nr:succinate dehydrogenase assembly factor 2 [Paracoccaceae bacterium]
MSEAPDDRLKRMRMRAWRRGMKEMDLIFGPWADDSLAGLDTATLDLFDAMMTENDQEIYTWFTGHTAPPDAYAPLVAQIGTHARARLAPKG